MTDPYFFGYGSLVNLATHDFPNPQPARLKGWRRAWWHTDLRPNAILTAIPDPTSEIDGMIAHVPENDWAALDQREWAYQRKPVTHAVTHPVTQAVDIAVYAVHESRRAEPTEARHIVLSYLDVVVQGYLRAFGPEEADRFFATTDGWDAPVLNDRAEPRYARHQQLRPEETSFVDVQLARLGSRFIDPD